MDYKFVFSLLCWIQSIYGDVDPLRFCKTHPTQLYPHSDCKQFIVCSNGYGYLQSCPRGTAYDERKKICTKQSAEECHYHRGPKSEPTPEYRSQWTSPGFGNRHDALHNFQTYISTFPSDDKHDVRPTSTTFRGRGGYNPSQPEPEPTRHNKPTHHGMVHTVHIEVPKPRHTERNYHRYQSESSSYKHNSYQGEDLRCTVDGSYPHPSDCTKYINCAQGRAHITACARGTFYNSHSKLCAYDKSDCGRDQRREPIGEPEPWSRDDPSSYSEPLEHKDRLRDRPRVYNDDKRRNWGGDDRFDWVGDKIGSPLITASPEDVRSTVMSHLDSLKSFATRRTREFHVEESRIAREFADAFGESHFKELRGSRNHYSTRRRGAYSGVQAFLGSTPYVKQLSKPAFYQLEALRMIRDKYDMEMDEFKEVMTMLPSFLKPNDLPVSPDMTFPTPAMDTCPYPRNDENNRCNPNEPFRSYDGSCNNLKRPLWGRSMRPLARFLPQDYADGIGEPRVSRAARPLPSARTVSLALFEDRDIPSHVHTLMHMTFGQFMDHDFSRAAVTKLSKNETGEGEMVDVTCGDTECDTRGPENRACLPISLPYGDPDFSRTNKTCLMFVRTQEVPADNCMPGPREQMNQLTSHLDASMIYGSDKDQADKLRNISFSARGRMQLRHHPYESRYKHLLPIKENKDCRDLNDTIQCFTAGDGRVNEHVGLASLHTIFQRGHNEMETKLQRLNPHWSGERLYQETRKIMGAAMQHIFYNEYLPLVMGPRGMDKFGLTLLKQGYFEGYDDTISTDITNVFTTAAFRFGHSQVDQLIRFAHQNYRKYEDLDLSHVLRRPEKIYDISMPGGSGIDSVTLGHISQPAQKVDSFFSKQVTAHLFSEDPKNNAPGTDLPALNIQRAREHGIPGYNDWREWCGLSRAKSFDDLVDIPNVELRRRFRQLYDSVDDIDLFAGGIVEQHIPGGMVGPTFGCILGRQFRNTRVGDRFWYERRDPVVGLTQDQLSEIRKFTLARFICDNLDSVESIQKFVLLQPISEAFRTMGRQSYAEVYSLASLYQGESNNRRPCHDIPDPDLRAWRER